jgi:hypothetical protein
LTLEPGSQEGVAFFSSAPTQAFRPPDQPRWVAQRRRLRFRSPDSAQRMATVGHPRPGVPAGACAQEAAGTIWRAHRLGGPRRSLTSSEKPGSPDPGSTARPTYAPRLNDCANAPAPRPDTPSPTGNAAATPHYCAGSSFPHNASANWRPWHINGYGQPWIDPRSLRRTCPRHLIEGHSDQPCPLFH